MSDQALTRNRVYQPLPAIGREHEADPPIYGVDGPDVSPLIHQASVKGMTKTQAQAIADRLNAEHGR